MSVPHEPISNDVSLLPVLRQLSETYLQVSRLASREIEKTGLTHAQFDVVVTLGDTPGLTCKELGEQTFITKGTLTSVLDRLEAKGLCVRAKDQPDSRQTRVALTSEGQTLYEEVFMPFIATMKPRFDVLSPAEQETLIALLQKLKAEFGGV